jgi:hypothetical protein
LRWFGSRKWKPIGSARLRPPPPKAKKSFLRDPVRVKPSVGSIALSLIPV